MNIPSASPQAMSAAFQELPAKTLIATVELSRTLKVLCLEGELCVYRLEYVCKSAEPLPPAFAEQFAGMVDEGYAFKGDLEVLDINQLHKPVNIPKMMLVPQELRAKAAHGFFSEFFSVVVSLPSYSLPYTAFVEGGAKIEDLCLVNISNHDLTDRFGKALPTAIMFDYISGASHDGAYDLEKALVALRAHPRVRLSRENMGNRSLMNSTPADAPVMICDVPYYNRDSGKSRFIPFTFTPSAEEAVQIQDVLAGQKITDEHEAVFILDLLGLRAAGAAYGQKYYDRREVEDSADELGEGFAD